MQKIERALLAQAQISGGDAKGGTSNATANSTVDLSLSNVTIPKGATVSIEINNSSAATAKA
jgi:hypothetical protein